MRLLELEHLEAVALERGVGRRLPAAHHDGMSFGMRATVTIRDDLFEEADRVASRLGISRSRLYQAALESYLRRLNEDILTEQVNSLVERAGEPTDEAFRRYIARAWKQSMGDDEW
jgi:hypothetical protein